MSRRAQTSVVVAPQRRFLRGAAAAPCIALAVCAGLAAWAERAPEAPLAQDVARVFPLVTTSLWSLRQPGAGKSPTAAHPGAQAKIDDLITLAPDRVDLWLAKVDALNEANGGEPTVASINALTHSYALSPLSLTYGAGRVRFAYDHWRALTPEVRKAVGLELKCLNRAAPEEALPTPDQVRDPAGRFALVWDLKAAAATDTLCRHHVGPQ